MGNSNSNTRNTRKPEWKVYKIIKKSDYLNCFRCHLDDSVPYNDGNYKHMDFQKDSSAYSALWLAGAVSGFQDLLPENVILDEGYYIAVDIEMTRRHSFDYRFGRSCVKPLGVDRVDSSGNLSFVEFVGGIGQAINEARERDAFMTQQSRYQNQFYAWHLEPPKK